MSWRSQMWLVTDAIMFLARYGKVVLGNNRYSFIIEVRKLFCKATKNTKNIASTKCAIMIVVIIFSFECYWFALLWWITTKYSFGAFFYFYFDSVRLVGPRIISSVRA